MMLVHDHALLFLRKRVTNFCIDVQFTSPSRVKLYYLILTTTPFLKTQLCLGLDNTCYPETLGKMLVINAPFLAVSTWSMVKRWLDPRTQQKIEVSYFEQIS